MDLKSISERQILLLLSCLGNFCRAGVQGGCNDPSLWRAALRFCCSLVPFGRGSVWVLFYRYFQWHQAQLRKFLHCSHPGSASQLCSWISLGSGNSLCGISVPFTVARAGVGNTEFSFLFGESHQQEISCC